MTSKSVVIVAVFYLLQVCNALDVIDNQACMENVNDTIKQYTDEYNTYIDRKYSWIKEVELYYEDKLPLLPGYDPENPQLCNALDYTYEVFRSCGGIVIDDSTYEPNFDNFSTVEEICKWLVDSSNEFYEKSNINKQVKANCDFDAGLDSYNFKHGLCYKEHIGTK